MAARIQWIVAPIRRIAITAPARNPATGVHRSDALAAKPDTIGNLESRTWVSTSLAILVVAISGRNLEFLNFSLESSLVVVITCAPASCVLRGVLRPYDQGSYECGMGQLRIGTSCP
jgi:hypothetical protein